MSERNVRFEWSAKKAASNLEKHGISFDEAGTAFGDAHAWIFDDEEHSDEEPREILVGYSSKNRLLMVSFVQRAPDRVRIVSARLADRGERETYEETPRF